MSASTSSPASPGSTPRRARPGRPRPSPPARPRPPPRPGMSSSAWRHRVGKRRLGQRLDQAGSSPSPLTSSTPPIRWPPPRAATPPAAPPAESGWLASSPSRRADADVPGSAGSVRSPRYERSQARTHRGSGAPRRAGPSSRVTPRLAGLGNQAEQLRHIPRGIGRSGDPGSSSRLASSSGTPARAARRCSCAARARAGWPNGTPSSDDGEPSVRQSTRPVRPVPSSLPS